MIQFARNHICAAAATVTAVLVSTGASMAAPTHPALAGLEHCVGGGDAVARAACYDKALAALTEAVRSGEIAIVQRREADAARRSAFGLNLPALDLFDRMGPAAAPLETVTAEAKSVRRDPLGRWIVELSDGAVWRQVDDEQIPSPRAGSTVEIRRAGLGNYFMRIDGRRGVRARRSD